MTRAALFLGLAGWLVVGSALALPIPLPAACFNDSDCPGAECGGMVCDWTQQAPVPDGDKAFVCVQAGVAPVGKDGWCTTDVDCKCRAQGAVCRAPYCTFTRPVETPGVAGQAAVAGASSTADPQQPVGRDDTGPRTSEACSFGASGNQPLSFPLFLASCAAAFSMRRRKRRIIPE